MFSLIFSKWNTTQLWDLTWAMWKILPPLWYQNLQMFEKSCKHWAPLILVCFTDPFSLTSSPQPSPSFQPQDISYPQLLSPLFLGRHGSRIGAVFVLNGQMNWYIIFFFRIIVILKRGYRSRLLFGYNAPGHCLDHVCLLHCMCVQLRNG